MTALFFAILCVAIVAELIKGLSANGTPPVLQKLPFQMNLAWVMWNSIKTLRIIFIIAAAITFFMIDSGHIWVALGAIPLIAMWYGVYWVFNRFWVGKYKFLPIQQKVFASGDDNKIDPAVHVLGVEHEGETKAYPVAMVMYHHQIADEIAGHPIWPTYCGLCRSGRVYDRMVDGSALDFELVGAITFNAVFADTRTGSWWRQELGEAAKGPMKGRYLDDIPFEQMTLKHWLAKHPDSQVLQYDPAFQKKYRFAEKMLNYEATTPNWHMQERPPLILGVDLDNISKAYDWDPLTAKRLLNDQVGDTPVVLIADADATSAFVYDRRVDGETLEFERDGGDDGDGLKDLATGSNWDQFGRCLKGKMKGANLTRIQSHKQNVRSWISFHPQTEFYDFTA